MADTKWSTTRRTAGSPPAWKKRDGAPSAVRKVMSEPALIATSFYSLRARATALCCLLIVNCHHSAQVGSPSEAHRPAAPPVEAQFVMTGARFEERHHGERMLWGEATAAEGNSDRVLVSRVTMFRKARGSKMHEGPFRAVTATVSLPAGAAFFTSATLHRALKETLIAPRGSYDPTTNTLRFEGPVELTGPGHNLYASGLEVDLLRDSAYFTGPVSARHQGFPQEPSPRPTANLAPQALPADARSLR